MTELLTPETFFTRMAEIRAQGGRVFRMDVGERNCDWEIQFTLPEPKGQEQGEMELG